MSYKKFRSLIGKGDEQGMTGFLTKEFPKNNRDQFHRDYENYNILKDLIRNGKKDLVKKCIEKGFPVNIDREDESFDGTPLHVAVLTECPEIVQLLLDNGSCIYKNNGNYETPLLLSAIAGIDQVTDLLLSHTEPIDYSNKEGFSHFHVACMRNQVELVHQFLMSGTDIHQSVKEDSLFWSGFTPLHFAVEYRSIETVEFLVKSGADVTITNKQDLTPLHLAFRKRSRKMIDILLSAQCFFLHNQFHDVGLSHFHIACATNNVAIVKCFLKQQVHEYDDVIDNDYNWCYYDSIQFAIVNDCVDVLEHLLMSDERYLNKRLHRILDDAYKKGSREVLNLIINHFEKKMVSFQCRFSVGNYSTNNEQDSNSTNNLSKSSDIQEHFERCDVSQQTKLHAAVLDYGGSSLVTPILETHPPSIITIRDVRGKTPLHIAFQNNQMKSAKQLLDEHLKIDSNPSDGNGMSHFHIACAAADINVVNDFLQKGVDVNSPVNINSPIWAGCIPLHFAVWFQQIKVAKLLLKHGANFAAKNASKLSSFDFAIPGVIRLSYKSSKVIIDYKDDVHEWELVKEMIQANSTRKIDGFDDRGITPLHVAAIYDDIHAIELLANADTINKRTDLNLPRRYAGLTPLHFAVRRRNNNAVTALLNLGADVAIQNVEKKTAGHLCEKSFFEKVGVRLLCSPIDLSDENGVSLFHLACKFQVIEAVEYYLKLGIDVNEPINSERNNEGKTPLHLAVEADDSEIVRLLLDHGANVNARDRYFATPMSLCKRTVVLKILLKNGADPQALDYECRTALCNAVLHMKDIDFTVLKTRWDINELNEMDFFRRTICPNDYSKSSLMEHIKSLMLLNVPINSYIKTWYYNNRGEISQKELSLEARCAIELNLMKETKIDNRTTLYDLLFKNSMDLAAYSKNETLQKIIVSEQDLRENYPTYACLIIRQFKKGQNRAKLLDEGKTSLSIIASQWMGDLACESILRFLNDYEIQCLIYATSGRNILER